MKRIFTIITGLIYLSVSVSEAFAVESKIKFNKETYNLIQNQNGGNEYNYYIKEENDDNWHTRINLLKDETLTNPTEAAADYAHKIQEKTPGASVLVYPDVAMVEYINFPEDRKFYEYNAMIFQPSKTKGLELFRFSKRFYSNEFDDTKAARKAAIDFAQQNSVKYMQMVNSTAPKYKID